MHHRERPPSGLLPEIWIGPQLSRLILFHEREDVEREVFHVGGGRTEDAFTSEIR